CSECRQPIETNVKALTDLGVKPDIAQKLQQFKGTGCRTCSNTGYKGRIAIYEVMAFTEQLKELVLQGASTAEVKAEAIRGGMKKICYSVLTDSQKASFEENNELDMSFGIQGLARFRANIFVQQGAVAGAFRLIPFKIRGFHELGLPPIVQELTKKPRGLILV